MRRILVERARRKATARAGGGRKRVDIEVTAPATQDRVDLLALDEALQQLEGKHERTAELVRLRFFTGLTNEQAARVLNISSSTADNDWAYARSFRAAIARGQGAIEG